MRVWWIALLAGCGFQVTVGGDGAVDDAQPNDTNSDGGARDASSDGAWTVADCPMDYSAIGNQATRYRLHTNATRMYAHHVECTQEGTHLAVIETTAEALALRQFVDGTPGLPAVGPYTLVFIGGAQRAMQPNPGAGWISATGELDGAFWNTGEPMDNGGLEDGEEQFAAIWRNHDLLADVQGNWLLSALCECDGKPITEEFKNLVQAGQ